MEGVGLGSGRETETACPAKTLMKQYKIDRLILPGLCLCVYDKEASTGEIIATSANQIVLPQRYKNIVLYSPDPPFLIEC